jgi:hypothetical protein
METALPNFVRRRNCYSPPQSFLHAISISSGFWKQWLPLAFLPPSWGCSIHPSSSKKVHIAFLSDSIIQTTQLADKSLPRGDLVFYNKISVEFVTGHQKSRIKDNHDFFSFRLWLSPCPLSFTFLLSV